MTTDDGNSGPCCEPVPATAMATGSEDGEPGEQVDQRPLTPDEAAILADLQRSPDVTATVEDSVTAERAVADDSVLPVDTGSGGNDEDAATPEFRAPPANR